MNLAITAELKRLIEQRMESGRYATHEEVLRAALRSLEQEEELGDFEPGELDALLAEGEQSGRPLDGEEVLAELRSLRLRHSGNGR